jgi:hypothetical protein
MKIVREVGERYYCSPFEAKPFFSLGITAIALDFNVKILNIPE